MTDAPDSGRRKSPDRRQAARRAAAEAPPADRRALVAKGPAVRQDRIASDAPEKAGATAAFAAQLLGQPGAKRGLKGGPEVIEGARSAYLETNYLGRNERRAPLGVIAKTKV